MSGAPLLNLRSGTVDGIVKLTRDEGAPLGARGIPASTILRVLPQLADAQTSHLRHDYRWVANMTPWQRWQANLEAEADEKRAVTDCLRGFSEDRLVAALACLPPRSAQEMPTSAADALSGRLFGADLALLKMVAAEKLGPNPAWNALDVYEMVGPHAWITVPAAARLRDLLDAPAAAGTRPVAVLNMAEEETGRLYVRFASRTYPLPLTWRVTVWQRDPLETAEDALAASLTAAVREALPRGVPVSAHDLFIKNNHVVVVIPPPPPDAVLLARLQSAQPGVTFLLLAGSSADDTVAALAASPAIQAVLLEPEGDPQLEQAWAQEFWLTRLTLKESP
jgi:hypothetical protein